MDTGSDWISFRQAAWRIAPCEGGIEAAKTQVYLRLGWVMSKRIDYPNDENGRPLDFACVPAAFDDPMPRRFLKPPPSHPQLAGKEPASPDWFGLWGQLWDATTNDSEWRDFNWQLNDWLYATDNLLVSWDYVQRAIVDRNASLSDGELENARAKVAWSFVEALAWIATVDLAEVALIGRHMASAGQQTRKSPDLFGTHIAEGVGRLAFIISERHCICGAAFETGVPRWKTCKCLSNAWSKLANQYAGKAAAHLPPELPCLEADLAKGVFGLTWPNGADTILFARGVFSPAPSGVLRFSDDQRREWILSQVMMSADKAHNLYKVHPRFCGTKLPEFRKEWGATKNTKRGRQPSCKSSAK